MKRTLTGNKWEKRFIFSMSSDCTHVPNLLLKKFRQLGLTETELVFILQLLMIGKNGCPSVEKISAQLMMEPAQVKQNLASLMEKEFIIVENVEEAGQTISRCFLDGLYDKLIDFWACEMAEKTDHGTGAKAGYSLGDRKFGAVFSAFEKEFGRPLSPMENDKIMEWLNQLGYQPEIILESLKRAVLRGVYNLNYVDRILLDWQKSNIRTVNEAVNHEKQKMGKDKKPVRKSAFTKNQGKNLDDLYEL